MKKKTFLKHLKSGLESLPKKEVKDIIADYEEYFAEGKADKRSEENIAKALGTPKKVAKQLKAEYHIKAAKKNTNARNIGKAILATISLGLLNLIIVLGPLIAVLAVIFSLYVSVISIWISSLAVIVIAIILLSTGGGILGIAALFSAIALVCVGIILLIGTNFIRKYVLKGIIYYLKFNVSIIKGEK